MAPLTDAEAVTSQAADQGDQTGSPSVQTPEALEAAQGAVTGVTLRLRENCAMPAARAWLIIQQMEAYGDVLSATTSLLSVHTVSGGPRTFRRPQ